ncbi:hypothetical protein FOZ61_009873 [Perkinsus olseni]|uniref:LicD/FKTN/FKRP nucleotidyltransferase domain-containing protein n=1 Tax=Perkinsus olseni TaxID=32597 RepID=A0A7J6L065_PEROL|nr:hypothetical protein FOZ61_009873 [Perkinsus olseni]
MLSVHACWVLLLCIPTFAEIVTTTTPSPAELDVEVSTQLSFDNPPLDRLYFCPRGKIEAARVGTSWPAYPVTLNTSECLNYDQIMGLPNRQQNLECIASATEALTSALDRVGLSESFLVWGSLLGWYRHEGGIIPWDFDGDVAVMKESCNATFDALRAKGSGVKNIAQAVDAELPRGFHIVTVTDGGVSRDLDTFSGCEAQELRIEGYWPGTEDRMCYTDLWFLDHESSEGADCHCDSIVPSPRACIENKYYSRGCISEADLFPLADSTLLGKVSVKVPNDPLGVLRRLYPAGIDIKNMAPVPKNPLFEDDWSIVVASSPTAMQQPRGHTTLWWFVAVVIVAILACLCIPKLYRCFVKRRRAGYALPKRTDDSTQEFVIIG